MCGFLTRLTDQCGAIVDAMWQVAEVVDWSTWRGLASGTLISGGPIDWADIDERRQEVKTSCWPAYIFNFFIIFFFRFCIYNGDFTNI